MNSGFARLTIPDPIRENEPFLVSGNEYVSLPMILPGSGAVQSLNVLSMRARGLVEFWGNPLIAPRLEIEGRALLSDLTWARLDDWVPQFSREGNGISLVGTICAPPGQRGFVYSFEAICHENARSIRLGVDIRWQKTIRTVFSSRAQNDDKYTGWDRWTQSYVCESSGALGEAAFAVGADSETEYQSDESEGACLARRWRLEPGERASLSFFVGVAAERDGARTTVVHLRRQGADRLVKNTREWLQSHRPNRAVLLPEVREKALYNLYFAYFYSVGTTIDSEESVLITSRSPLYYVSAAMWPRDALLWSLPGILEVDTDKARDVLHTAFRRHLKHPGEHAQYIDGCLLYPGFELDQLAAFPIALYRYLKITSDRSILKEPEIKVGLDTIVRVLLSYKHPTADLFRTFLLSTDDPVAMPYVTYSNVLASIALVIIGEITKRPALVTLGHRVHSAIYRECTVPTEDGRMFAGAVDLEGRRQVFDEPPGSLVLLPAYGFCAVDDPVYQCTVQWINSSQNPHFAEHAQVPMPGCTHSPYAWPMSLVNQVLANPQSAGAAAAKHALAEMPLDGGLACETVDEKTGIVKTGRMMASFAGWLGYALIEAERKSEGWIAFLPDHKMRKTKRAQRG